MKKIATLISTDLKHIFRDKTLIFYLFVPFFLFLFVRLGVPKITETYPLLANYHAFIMMSAAIQTAVMFGFIISFIILDEKDEQVLQAIRVLPISPFYFIMYRLLFASAFSALGAFFVIQFSGLAYPGLFNTFLLSIQYGLVAPFITLIIATYANNKVEGMALFKGVDLVLMLPLLSLFTDHSAKYILSLIPVFWTYNLYESSLTAGQNTLIYFFVGIVAHTLVLALLFLQFKKRVFDR